MLGNERWLCLKTVIAEKLLEHMEKLAAEYRHLIGWDPWTTLRLRCYYDTYGLHHRGLIDFQNLYRYKQTKKNIWVMYLNQYKLSLMITKY